MKKTAIFAMMFFLFISLFGCKSLSDSTTVSISNGTETITPFLLLNYAYIYDDSSGNWTSGDGIGGHQFDIADYEAEFPSINVTDKLTISIPDKTKCSAAKIYNADYQVIEEITLAEISITEPGTYILRFETEKTGRTIGDQTEKFADVGFVKIIVGAP